MSIEMPNALERKPSEGWNVSGWRWGFACCVFYLYRTIVLWKASAIVSFGRQVAVESRSMAFYCSLPNNAFPFLLSSIAHPNPAFSQIHSKSLIRRKHIIIYITAVK